MRITVHSEGHRFFIPVPTGLIANRLTARIAAKTLKESGMELSAEDLRRLFQALRRSRKVLKKRPLVEVDSADGTYVKILL